ncbi:uncharacterized protein J4E88_005500 [Alternaria novae-zelandiae]|uniref:uncharacterized protein n=1 Tax=Alternaria metachromatica TaxID=283354 RepID=UPI0020C2EBB7|nr:uncharacterized protein J4E83_002367 [Alternaria metachromatica]XP_049254927.1 uncharacterized protein J4E88_005500 [Alternaria novae-zelandiae]KAI4635043.1 hypothetical protein J4E83_002367 [Alternaria metachromatica]KAI4680995.1 hypothetical protein J4E88_005500 [Alternaria novae-zelandiae]
MAKKSKAAKRARKAESDAEAWKASSKTVLGRLTYRLEELPDLLIVPVRFYFLKKIDDNGDPDFGYVYAQKHRDSAWTELFNDTFVYFKNIAAINKKPDGKSYESHLIIPCHSMRDEDFWKSVRPGDIPLKIKFPEAPQNSKDVPIERPMKCSTMDSFVLKGKDEEDRKLYYKSLGLLIQKRHATMFPRSNMLRMAGESFHSTPNGSKAITPMVKGCATHQGNETQTPSPADDPHRSSHSPYSLRIRNYLSTNLRQKLVHLTFDLTCTLPTTYDSMYKVLLDVFGEKINAGNIDRLQPAIEDLLIGLQVQRNYSATKSKTTAGSIETWYKPFPIREVVQAVEVTVKSKNKANNEDKEVQTVYEYFEENYNDGNEIEHQYLPLVGDGRGCYFPLTYVKLPEKTQVFPRTAGVLAQPLQTEIHELDLLNPNGPKFMEDMGERVWAELTKERLYDEDTTEYEASVLLKRSEDKQVSEGDPLDLVL